MGDVTPQNLQLLLDGVTLGPDLADDLGQPVDMAAHWQIHGCFFLLLKHNLLFIRHGTSPIGGNIWVRNKKNGRWIIVHEVMIDMI